MTTRPNLVELKNHPCYSDVSGRLDPHCMYVARAREHLVASKLGIERFAYELFGPTIIGSLAFALDPTSKFNFSKDLIAPTNRTRVFTCVYPSARSYSRKRESHILQNQVTCIGGTRDQGRLDYKTYLNLGSANLSSQQHVQGFVSDSTVRTRTLTQKYGEFEMFAPKLLSPTKHHVYTDMVDSTAETCGLTQYLRSYTSDISTFKGPGATVPASIFATLLTNERTNASTLMGKHVAGLITRALPEHRTYDLYYNLAELKDLPRMLRGATEHYRRLQSGLSGRKTKSFTGRDAANEYLSYKFGWEATVKSIRKMLQAPTLVAKRMNFLLERNGVPTTTRSSMKFEETMSNVPAFDYFNTVGESTDSLGQIAKRSVELRCVVNSIINMPKVSIPQLNMHLYDQLFGVIPSPADTYNLIPWSWLIDWFSGLGDYLNAVEKINSDPSLVNYGFLTYKSVGQITGTHVTKSTEFQSYSRSPPLTQWFTSSVRKYHYSARLQYRYQLRKDIGTLPGVKAITLDSSLSTEQKAIIGALLTKFTR